jgi:hypothetical protein
MAFQGTKEQLKSIISQLKSQGKTESTSKELGKRVTQLREGDYTGASAGGFGSTSVFDSALQSRLSDFYGGLREESTAALEAAREKLGLPELEQQKLSASGLVRNLQGQLESLPEQVKQTARGFDVNAAQLAQIQQARQEPLYTQLSQAGSGLEAATEALSVGLQAVQPFIDLEADIRASQITGFNAALQTELDQKLAAYNAGLIREQKELDRIAELADAETEFLRQKELIKLQTQSQLQLQQAKSLTSTDSGGGLGLTEALGLITGGGTTKSTTPSTYSTPSVSSGATSSSNTQSEIENRFQSFNPFQAVGDFARNTIGGISSFTRNLFGG